LAPTDNTTSTSSKSSASTGLITSVFVGLSALLLVA
jgi:hypothetical protein